MAMKRHTPPHLLTNPSSPNATQNAVRFMGAVLSTRNEERVISDAIDRQIEEELKSSLRVNILLLGTDPEMSTIVKQMNIQHGLTSDQLLRYRLVIYRNSLDNAQALVHAIRSMGIEYADPTNRGRADLIVDYQIQHTLSFVFSPQVAEAIHQVWQDPVMPKVMDRQHEFGLSDSAEYFFNEILRIGSPEFLPTDNDILLAQKSLSKVAETCLTFGALQVSIIDVGKQHTPKKWLPYFEDVNYIMFCVSLSDYDKVLPDDSQNELDGSLIVFESIARSPWFAHSTIILFLTNFDEFEYKLSKVPLETYFSDYPGGANVNVAMEYIRARFMRVNQAGLPIYFIQHRATNSSTLRSIFGIVKRTILQDAWKDLRNKPSRSAAMRIWRLRRMFSPNEFEESRVFSV